MTTDIAILEILLHDEHIATLTHLPGDKNLLSFTKAYREQKQRPMISLSFEDMVGDLIVEQKITRTRLSPYFSNLLPEGHMREYLASQARMDVKREFYLLAALGRDLPGALKVRPVKLAPLGSIDKKFERAISSMKGEKILRFSLAGIQLKFSAILENHGGLTIPVDGVGGSWIVKLPSSVYAGVPENEYMMMKLAKQIGIDVPEIDLVSIDQISGLPEEIGAIANHAFITKRFDRDAAGRGIHIEDFTQVFGVYPEKKYQAANYRNIAQVIWSEIGEKGVEEFIRRFVFNALIGNGDMHLKNWSLIYPNKRDASLAPAYDFVSTIPYLPQDMLALNFVDSKSFHSLNERQFKRFAAKTHLPEELIIETMRKTVRDFKKIWASLDELHLYGNLFKVIDSHVKSLPLYNF